MSSLKAKDRVSLCMFTFADGRRCRTPRAAKHPHFCFYHAQKEARARAAETLGKDLAYFFSGDYLSACDLSTALGRLIPAVLRGDVKPRAARTVAYLAQTLMQAIHISQDEYTNAFGSDAWRKSIRNSVHENLDYRFPPAPQPNPAPAPAPEPPQVQAPPAQAPNAPADPKLNCHSACPDTVGEAASPAAEDRFLSAPSLRGEPAFSPSSAPQPNQQSKIPTPSGPAPSPRASLPPTSAEFAQQVLASSNSSPATRHSFTPSEGERPLPARPAPNRDPYALHFDHNCRLHQDNKLL